MKSNMKLVLRVTDHLNDSIFAAEQYEKWLNIKLKRGEISFDDFNMNLMEKEHYLNKIKKFYKGLNPDLSFTVNTVAYIGNKYRKAIDKNRGKDLKVVLKNVEKALAIKLEDMIDDGMIEDKDAEFFHKAIKVMRAYMED